MKQDSVTWVEALYRAAAEFSVRERQEASVKVVLSDGEEFFLAHCEAATSHYVCLYPLADNGTERERRAVLVPTDMIRKVVLGPGPAPFPLRNREQARLRGVSGVSSSQAAGEPQRLFASSRRV